VWHLSMWTEGTPLSNLPVIVTSKLTTWVALPTVLSTSEPCCILISGLGGSSQVASNITWRGTW
jgi:hypothetical protein